MRFLKWRRHNKDDRLGIYLKELNDRPQSQIMPSDVVKFSDPLRAVFNHAIRMGKIKLEDVCEHLELSKEQAQQLIDVIVKTGYLRPPSPLDDEPVYRIRLAVRTKRGDESIPTDILKKLDDL